MNSVREIDERIETLRNELAEVQGTPTEIYARIVGYYRSLKNWNRGKREEYNYRVAYRPNRLESRAAGTSTRVATNQSTEQMTADREDLLHETAQPTGPKEVQGTGGHISSYAYFYRESCPKCPSVKSYVDGLPITGQAINVDTGEGMSAAVDYQILSTPTVVLFDDAGHRVAHAGSVDQLRTIMESVG